MNEVVENTDRAATGLVDERVQFSGNCCHSERSAKRGGEESAFDYVAEKQIPHFPDSRDRLFGMTFPQH